MEVLILICGIVLILMSLVLLLLSPAAVLGIIAGVLVVILRKKLASNFKSSSAKSKEIFQEEMKHRRAEYEEKIRIKREIKAAAAEVKRIQAEEAEQKARQIHLAEEFALFNISKEVLSKYQSTKNEMSKELRYLYDRGERIFRDNYSFSSANIEISDSSVVVDGNVLGFLNPSCLDIISQIQSQSLKTWFDIDVCYGYYAKIVRNPEYNREIDDEDDKNCVEYSTLKSPEVTLRLHYCKERKPL